MLMNILKKLLVPISLGFFLTGVTSVFADEIKPENKNSEEEPVRTIIDSEKIRVSGYGAPVVRFGGINNGIGIFTGGRGGAIINNSLVLGGGGFGLVYPKSADASGNSRNIGYGGFLMEYYFFPKNVINFSIGTLIGAGGGSDYSRDNSSFFVLEPEVNVFVNVTRFFKLGLGASYRYTSGLQTGSLTDSNFRGFSVGMIFEFGRF